MSKILTIEDSAFERKAIAGMLKKGGYLDIIEAEEGEKGIELFKEENPDLVLLDLRMPGISGMDVLKKLREIDRSAKIIVVSIVRKQETIEEALDLGALDYVTKPITKDRLIPSIKKALEGD